MTTYDGQPQASGGDRRRGTSRGSDEPSGPAVAPAAVGSPVVILRPVGDLDMFTAPAAHPPPRGGAPGLPCDRRSHRGDVPELDSPSDLQTFMQAHDLAQAHNGVLEITGAHNRCVQRPPEVSGWSAVLRVSKGSTGSVAPHQDGPASSIRSSGA